MCIPDDPIRAEPVVGPRRIQLHRRRVRCQPEGAVSVTRPWRWGNPFVVGDIGYREHDTGHEFVASSPTVAVAMYRQWLAGREFVIGFDRPTLHEIRADLAGHDLGCWCPLDQVCHGDTLLLLANTGQADAGRLLARWRALGDSILTRADRA